MHMNSAPHLLNEDRQDYERILDEALRSAQHNPDLADVGDRLTVEQLRTMALNATALITAAAAAEYQHFVQLRGELRRPSARMRTEPASRTGPGAVGLATGLGGVTETAGAGLVAVLAVLAPVLAGTAAAIFLIIGYVLKMLSPEPTVADALLTTGWVFAALTAAGILVAAVGLLLTALRNAPTSLRADATAERDAAVDRAREAWHQALLERGVLPFLREALTSSSGPDGDTGSEVARMPQLGYHRPGFSSPDGGPDAGPPPSYSSPDFTSPDFGGPDHQPE
ncbi:hypothetical protein DSC45_26690 [Streptomyces sp. YIM 130001]|uniref:hypothetical protein n=1 Tax=Streptomyces sp. YIM 130001 TaxID=2259644 RepID=UPI000E650F07|nr:hypothetical protein [Streptomyces sp. YIM 130001]RII11889.1 hypothetical protein DSC45_26690 [Streptomyces sp. YIM 130001]